MRALLFALPFLLVACGSETDSLRADGATDTAPSTDGAADPDLVGFWSQQYTQYSKGGNPRTLSTSVYWTLREDGTALEAKQHDRLGASPLTVDYTWSRSGDQLSFLYANDGAEGPQYEVVRLEGDTLVVKHAGDRERYTTYARGPVDE